MNNNTITAPEKKFTIELKNVRSFRGSDFYGLNAMVYINGIKCFYLIDDGNGGIMYNHQVINKDLYNEFKAYTETLPPKNFKENGMPVMDGDKLYLMPQTIDNLCDEAYDLMQQQKAIQKREKKMTNTIMWGRVGDDRYYSVKLSRNIADIPHDDLVKITQKYTAQLKEGEVIFNTNLPKI